MTRALVAVFVLLYATPALAQMVICTKPDGSKYVGPTPPEGCESARGVQMPKIANNDASQSDYAPEKGEAEAIVACHNAVKDKLKSPATAQFPPVDSISRKEGWDRIIRGVVDSQNPMGGMMRTNYSCSAKHHLEGYWSVT